MRQRGTMPTMPETAEPKSEFDAFSRTYDDAVNASVAFSGLKADFFTRVKAAYIKDIVAAAFVDPAALDVLDIGCGIGNYHPYLADVVGSISGVDVSASCLATAAERHPEVRYRAYDGLRLPFADATFDVAYTICVVHHVPPAQWQAFAHEMRRVLKPGGLALIFEHNPFNPLTRRAVSSCVFDKDAVLLRARRAEALLVDAGLVEVTSRYILSIPAGTSMLRRIDGWFARLPLGAQYLTQGRRA